MSPALRAKRLTLVVKWLLAFERVIWPPPVTKVFTDKVEPLIGLVCVTVPAAVMVTAFPEVSKPAVGTDPVWPIDRFALLYNVTAPVGVPARTPTEFAVFVKEKVPVPRSSKPLEVRTEPVAPVVVAVTPPDAGFTLMYPAPVLIGVSTVSDPDVVVVKIKFLPFVVIPLVPPTLPTVKAVEVSLKLTAAPVVDTAKVPTALFPVSTMFEL